MLKAFINLEEFFFIPNISVLEACSYAGFSVPRFCYHQTLSIAGNCRMCVVELVNSPKPVASCALLILNNIEIYVNSPLVKKARENIMETLLLNHPLDCPICDQAGECDLQNQSKTFGIDSTRFRFLKRTVEDKVFGSVIKTIMTRCIHCTRCVRYNSEISGEEFLGTLNRGSSTEIGSYTLSDYNSDLSGNVIDLCPVGALTSKPYSFKARPWELITLESILLTDGLGSSAYISFKESEVVRVFPKTTSQTNERFISNKARFYFDSNKINRLKTPKHNKEIISSEILLKVIKNSFFNLRPLVLTNNFLDLHTLLYSKFLENDLSKDKKKLATVKNIGHFSKKTNFLTNWLNSSTINIETSNRICFVISSNLKIENSTLNLKLRSRVLYSSLAVFGFTKLLTSDFKTKTLNLSLYTLYKILESKVFVLSSVFSKSYKPLIILGEDIFKRGLRFDFFFSQIKNLNFGSEILKVHNAFNLEGSSFLNISNFTSRSLKRSESIFLLNVEDSFVLKKLLNNYDKTIFLFSTHNSEIINVNKNKNVYYLPFLTEFESSKIFFNIEQKFIKTSKSFHFFNKEIFSFKDLYLNVIGDKKNYDLYCNFSKDFFRSSNSFSLLNNCKIFNSYILKQNVIDSKFFVSSYPSKILVENLNFGNKMLKNSLSQKKALISIKV
jgi:NADH-quinone oxidoreductase chain G